MLHVYCDGLCEPFNDGKRGVATCGWLIQNEERTIIASGAHFLKEGEGATNNLAEYGGVIRALSYLWKEKAWELSAPIQLYSDSQLVIRQLKGEYAVRSDRVRPLFEQTTRGLAPFRNLTLHWIPRENNAQADQLAQQAYAQHVLQHGETCIGAKYLPYSRVRTSLEWTIRQQQLKK